MANQPMSTSSNNNTYNKARKAIPKKKPPLKFQKYKKSGVSAAKAVDNKQSAAINQLSKQVYDLQMSKYGKIQQNYHNLTVHLTPNNVSPICFDMTDFTCERLGLTQAGGSVFQHIGGAPDPDTVAHWQRDNVTLNNYYWENQNQDAPDSGAYLAMDCTYFFEIRGNRALSDTRLRLDIISQKPDAVLNRGTAAIDSNLSLPDTLGYFKHLTRPYLNRINPSFFKKYISKVVYINSSKTNAHVKGTTGNNMRFSMKLKPNKLCIQNETNPTVNAGVFQDQEDPGVAPAVEAEYAYGNYGPLNVPVTQPLWCIISSDDVAGGDSVEVYVSRRIRWRDSIGSSAI